MTLAVKEDEALYPLKILRFCADTVMFYTQTSHHLLDQFGWMRGIRASGHQRCVSLFQYIQNRCAKLRL